MNKLKKALKYFNFFLLSLIFNIAPIHKKRWVFGSWFGSKFTDNTKWLFLKVIYEYKTIDAVFITKDIQELEFINSIGGKALIYNSFIANYYVATADVVFMTHGFLDLSPIYLIRRAYKVNLWHGVAFKKIGLDAETPCKKITIAQKLKKAIKSYWNSSDLYIAPSEEYASKIKSAFKTDDYKILKTGQPRNDLFFYANSKESPSRKDFLIKAGVYNSNKRIISYLPTFRDRPDKVFDFDSINVEDLNKLNCILEKNNALLVQKKHFIDNQRINKTENFNSNIISISQIDTSNLLLYSDLLITDYSSCYFDFLLLNRPVIHFVYDYEYYKSEDRGLYYDLNEVCGGKICYDINTLFTYLEEYLENPSLDSQQRNAVKNRFVSFEDGRSSSKIIDYVIKIKYCKS